MQVLNSKGEAVYRKYESFYINQIRVSMSEIIKKIIINFNEKTQGRCELLSTNFRPIKLRNISRI